MKTNEIITLMYLLVTTICVGISTFSSILGLRSLLNELAIPFGIMIGLTLFASDFMIQKGRKNGRWGRPLLMLLFAMIFSVVSNFNFFYTNAISHRAIDNRLQIAYQTYDRNLGSAISILSSSDDFKTKSERERYIRAELNNLRDEALDKNQFGIGPESKFHIENIKTALGEPLANVEYPALGTSNAENAGIVSEWIDAFEARVSIRLNLIDEQNAVIEARSEFERKRETAGNKRAEILNGSEDEKMALVRSWERDTPSVETRLLQALEGSATGILSIDAISDPISADGMDLGEIYYSLHDGFVLRTDFFVTVVALLASVLIDIIPLLFALLLISEVRSTGAENDEEINHGWFRKAKSIKPLTR